MGENTVPSNFCWVTTTPTGLAITEGSVPGAGVPTVTESSRTSEPARNVSVAVPATPVTSVTLADRAPAGITTGPDTFAIPASLVVTVTVFAEAAADDRS